MEGLLKKFFQPSKKVIADKAAFPEETVSRVENRLKSLGVKVYKGVQRIDKGRLGIPVYISLYDIDGQRITGNFKQMGKGSTEVLAKASALMELVERFSLFSFYRSVETVGRLTTFEELGEDALSWEIFLRSVEDDEQDKVKEIAYRYIKKTPMWFVPGLEVTTKKVKYLPFHWFWILYEYNGSAGGNTYPEAAIQAICELIERHVNALSVRKGIPMAEIKRSSISGEGERLLSCYERLGIKVWIRDMTFGMPAPTIAVMAMDPSTYPHRSEIVYAAGTGTSPERALIRALTEVAQLAGDFDTEGKYLESGLPKFRTLEEASQVLATNGEVSLEDLPNLYSEDHTQELEVLTDKLKEIGYQTYLIDITRPDLEIPAVYAVIPGILFRERTKISYLYQFVRTLSLYFPLESQKSILEDLIKEVPDRYFLWAFLGNVYKELKEFSKAISAYQKALGMIDFDDDKIALYTHLADAYLKDEQYKKAVETALQGLSLEEVPELYNILGRAYYKLEEYFLAMEAFCKAIDLNPASAIDYANVGYCLKALNQLPTAEVFFLKALELNPDLTVAKMGLEYCGKFLNNQN
ncbi:YcaO-like family protein [Thermodesulfobacterium sp.]|jgi:ribosomal protein S12 methylthiotransferase accessory factor|uniref:YcaO-like family protein n=1 Tax=Thermodesulfobacterium sp. TaxID=1965289 RepID=UPI0025796C6B|nr:YcaO-like family protein [Thermodesulfobacterium sp.]MBZ4681906.1 tetratricopeptide repeat protein [Thermodesulfobacterium sp.]MDN5379445.1 ribosomal protein methylthiotransferase accessory factor [Thermodesulfobacterium sp.]